MKSIFVVKGNDQGTQFELSEETVTLGRGPGNNLRLHDVEISRRHAEIRSSPSEGAILHDLESSNGLFVNGHRVTVHRLSNGDQIQIGRTLLLFSSATDSAREDVAVVDFDHPLPPGEESRIVHSVREDEGKGLYPFETDAAIPSEWLKTAKAHLNIIYHTALVVSQTLDIDRLLQRILEMIFEWVEIDRGCILLLDPTENRLIPKISRRRNPSADSRFSINPAVIDHVLTKKEGILTNATTQELADSMIRYGVQEAICVPMLGRYGLVGMIYIDITSRGQNGASPASAEGTASDRIPMRFTPDHLKLMFAIGHQAALAVEDTQYYQAMIQSERLAAVGQTVAVVSHHIKNILQGIRGGSYLIERGLADHDESMVGKGWGIVEKNQSKISDLILDMLTFSKKRVPFFEKSDLVPVLADVCELMRGRCLEQNVEILFSPAEPSCEFWFDAEPIHRAVTNLVANAIDAMPTRPVGFPPEEIPPPPPKTSRSLLAFHATTPNRAESTDSEDIPQAKNTEEKNSDIAASPGKIEVALRLNPERNQVIVTVEDNGPGVPSALRDELFRPFFSRNKRGGTGLGLAVTAKIVQEHHGTIRVEDSPSGGARFVMELPVTKEKPTEEEC